MTCRAFITETLIPPKDEEDTGESEDKSDFRDYVSAWLDKFRSNKTEMEKVITGVKYLQSAPEHSLVPYVLQRIYASFKRQLCEADGQI